MNVTSQYESSKRIYTDDTLKLFLLLATSALAIIVATRLFSGRHAEASPKTGGRFVPLIPYWIPFIGHIVQLALIPERFFKNWREQFPHGITSIVLAGSTHNIVWSPSLAQAIFSQRSSVVDFESVIWYILVNVAGIPKKFEATFERIIPQLTNIVTNCLLRDATLQPMVHTAVSNIEQRLPVLISGASRPIDQTPWEKLADAEAYGSGDDAAVEVDLLSLLINFTGHCSIASIFGSDFHNNYPNLLTDLWAFNDGFLLLAAGLPRWLPIPTLTRAYGGRERVTAAIGDLHAALEAEADGRDPGSKWDNLDEVSSMIKQRGVVYRDNAVPTLVRGKADLAIFWAMNANSNYLIFWLLLRILSDSDLTQRIRAETSSYITIVTPAGFFPSGIRDLPRIKIDERGISTACPLFRSCYIESLRLDSAPWSLKKVLQDFTITESLQDALKRGESRPQSYRVKAGTYADVPFDVHFRDPVHFVNPLAFVADRHIVDRTDEELDVKDGAASTVKAEFGTVRPYGGGRTMCKGRVFAEKECLVIVAGMLALYDFEPVDKEGWKIPRHGKATAVSMPKDKVRARIKRRVV